MNGGGSGNRALPREPPTGPAGLKRPAPAPAPATATATATATVTVESWRAEKRPRPDARGDLEEGEVSLNYGDE